MYNGTNAAEYDTFLETNDDFSVTNHHLVYKVKTHPETSSKSSKHSKLHFSVILI